MKSKALLINFSDTEKSNFNVHMYILLGNTFFTVFLVIK